MTYSQLKQKHQEEVNAFPIGAAFSNEQFEEMMTKWGLTTKDTNKILSLGAGCFIRKSDEKAFDEMISKHSKELKEFKKNEKQFIDAIQYEMANHELIYAYNDADTKASLGLTDKDFEDEYVVNCWNKALKKYKKYCFDNDIC